MDCVLVGRYRVGVASHPDVDVGGHVDEVPGARHQRREPLGARHRFLRRHGLDRVDVVVACTGVARVGPQHALELGHDLAGPGIGLPGLLVPVVPRTLVHQRLGVQRRGVEVVGIPLHDLAHGHRVRRVERRARGRRDRRVPLRECADVGLFPRARMAEARLRLPETLVGREPRRRVHSGVHVRAVRVGHSPVAHGAVRVQPRGMGERADGLTVVEAVQQSHALVEVPLGEGDPGGDRDVIVAQVCVQGDRVTGCAGERRQRHEQGMQVH